MDHCFSQPPIVAQQRTIMQEHEDRTRILPRERPLYDLNFAESYVSSPKIDYMAEALRARTASYSVPEVDYFKLPDPAPITPLFESFDSVIPVPLPPVLYTPETGYAGNSHFSHVREDQPEAFKGLRGKVAGPGWHVTTQIAGIGKAEGFENGYSHHDFVNDLFKE